MSAKLSCETCNGVSLVSLLAAVTIYYSEDVPELNLLILTGFKDAYYGEPDLIVIPEGQENAHTGKSAFIDLITVPVHLLKLPGDKNWCV